MFIGLVSDLEEMELWGLQWGYLVFVFKRLFFCGVQCSYILFSDNLLVEEEDFDGEEEQCVLGVVGGVGGCKRKWFGVVGSGGGKKFFLFKGLVVECKQLQWNVVNVCECVWMCVLSKVFFRFKISLFWVFFDIKFFKLDMFWLVFSYIVYLWQLLQEDCYENGYVYLVNLVGVLCEVGGEWLGDVQSVFGCWVELGCWEELLKWGFWYGW